MPVGEPADAGQAQKGKRSVKRSAPVALEVKLLAIEALESDLPVRHLAEIVGVADGTLSKWRRQHQEGGLHGLCRRASSIAVRRQVSQLEECILAHRREHPEYGVRRIRDELRRNDGLAVSAGG